MRSVATATSSRRYLFHQCKPFSLKFAGRSNTPLNLRFSPFRRMGKMLTYADGRSTHYAWDRNKRVEFADENYAREIMQLFSIGLIKLNNDGSPILDQDGKPIRTYSNDHIMEYARSWTAFHSTSARGNIETNVGSKWPVVAIGGYSHSCGSNSFADTCF
jgi:uncharacterized protein (DUF1800 family)